MEPPLKIEAREPRIAVLEEDLLEYLSALDDLARRLADEQLRLMEEIERLLAVRAHREKEHYAQVKELEGRNLQLRKDERLLQERVLKLRQDQVELDRTRRSVEAGQARLKLESSSYQDERERLLAQIHSLKGLVERMSTIGASAECGNQKQTEAEHARLRHELSKLQALRSADEQQIKELTALVERLAGLLLEDNDQSASIAKAA